MQDSCEMIPLSELFDFGSGLSKPRADFGSGFGFLSFKDVFYNYFVPDQLEQLVNSTDKEQETCSVKRGDVFLTRTSETQEDLGMSCVALKDYERATFNGFTKRLRPKFPDRIVPEYAGYFFRSKLFRLDVTAMSSLSTRASLNNEMLGRLKMLLPPVEQQKDIGRVLKSFDDKIGLNRRMNATLEAMARALFKAWFVDFEPVHANKENRPSTSASPEIAKLFPSNFENGIPKGWELKPLTEFFRLIGGGTPKTWNPEFWNGDIPWYSVVDAPSESDVFVIDTGKKITQAGLERSSTRLLRKGVTIISARGTVGKLAITGNEMTMNQSCYAVEGKFGDYFTFYVLRAAIGELKQKTHGAVFDTITQDTFKSISELLPDPEITSAFENIVGSIMQKIEENLRQNKILSEIRDALLPRLISGRILVKHNAEEIE